MADIFDEIGEQILSKRQNPGAAAVEQAPEVQNSGNGMTEGSASGETNNVNANAQTQGKQQSESTGAGQTVATSADDVFVDYNQALKEAQARKTRTGHTVTENQITNGTENTPGKEAIFVPNQVSGVDVTSEANDKVEAQTQEPMYLADWGKVGAKGILNSRATIRDSIQDYFKWCRENDVTPDVQGLMMYSDNQDMKKTGAKNADDERKRKRYERNEQLGNFFMSLGDFVGSVGWGGPEQKIESSKELTARQQKLRDSVEAKRDAYNTKFINSILKQKQMDEDERKLTLAERKQDAEDDYRKAQAEATRAHTEYQNALLKLQIAKSDAEKEKAKEEVELKKKAAEQKDKELELKGKQINSQDSHYRRADATAAKNANTASYKAHHQNKGGGKGSEDHYNTEFDKKGNVVKVTQYTKGTYKGDSSSKVQRDSTGKKRIKK